MDTPTGEASQSRVPIILGIAAIVVWAHYVPSLWPLPPRTNVLPAELQWSLWRENLVLIALGLLAAILALRRVRFWQPALLATSGYVVFFNVPPMIADVIRAGSIQAWFGLFRNVRPTTVYDLVALPLYHLAIVGAVLAYAAVSLGTKSNVQRNAA